MSDKYFVVCYNMDEYKTFIHRKAKELYDAGHTSISFSNFIYLDYSNKLLGYRNPKGWFYGRWRERVDIKEIVSALIVCQDKHNDALLRILKEVNGK
jgi:hypothetical protein